MNHSKNDVESQQSKAGRQYQVQQWRLPYAIAIAITIAITITTAACIRDETIRVEFATKNTHTHRETARGGDNLWSEIAAAAAAAKATIKQILATRKNY